MNNTHKSVAVIGAGPVGMAAAAHLIEKGLKPVIFEKETQWDTLFQAGGM